MKKKTPFLDFFRDCAENDNKMPIAGLCSASIRGDIPQIPEVLKPTEKDIGELHVQGQPCVFWGSEFHGDGDILTSRRATILCFAALLTKEY